MGTITIDNNKVEGLLSVFVFLDTSHPKKNVWVAYCPELDLVGSDYGEENAKKSFETVLKEYINYTMKQGTLKEDLLSHGWQEKDNKWIKPSYKMLVKEGKLDEVFEQQNFSKYSIPVTA